MNDAPNLSPLRPGPPVRPGVRTLLLVYAVWLGLLAAFTVLPQLLPFGILWVALVLFISLPFWAWRNWSFVVEDLPATYATVFAMIVEIVVMGIYSHFDISSLGYYAVKAGLLQPRQIGIVDALDNTCLTAIFSAFVPTWHFLYRLFTRRAANAQLQSHSAELSS